VRQSLIAVISSTIYPPASPMYDGKRSVISPDERLSQTQDTVKSLVNLGFSDIYICDNSGDNWVTGTEEELTPAKVHIFNAHQYNNKGISELYLLLKILNYIPSNQPILKISGRYTLSKNILNELGDSDLGVKIYNHPRNSSMSTRCYCVKNKDIYSVFLHRVLNEVYGYSSRIVGPRSLKRIIHNSIFPTRDSYRYDDPTHSIESASAWVLRNFNYKTAKFDVLGVEGFIAGRLDCSISE
jgi:hypothetical protein